MAFSISRLFNALTQAFGSNNAEAGAQAEVRSAPAAGGAGIASRVTPVAAATPTKPAAGGAGIASRVAPAAGGAGIASRVAPIAEALLTKTTASGDTNTRSVVISADKKPIATNDLRKILAETEHDLTAVEQLRTYLSSGRSKEEQYAAFCELSNEWKETLCYWTWYMHGSPDKDDYGRRAIQENPSCLTAIKAPLIFSRGENILEQIKLSLEAKKRYLEATDILNQLQSLEAACSAGQSKEALRAAFQKLPVHIQRDLICDISKHFPGQEHREALESNVMILLHLKTDGGIPYMTNAINWHKANVRSIEESVFLAKKEQFKALVDGGQLTHKELKKYYRELPDCVRDCADVPKPPYFGRGLRSDLYETLGAHPSPTGTMFRVYAPNALAVHLALRDEEKDIASVPMVKKEGGIWEVHAEGVRAGARYQYLITTKDGELLRKFDPYAFHNTEWSGLEDMAIVHDSVVADVDSYAWNDAEWMAKRAAHAGSGKEPNIYELHVAHWKRTADGKPLHWKDLALELAAYCKEMHYTHVELIGLLDHPRDISWGYQPTGYFSPNFRLGNPKDFQAFVDILHQNGIGVLMDWIPGHFSTHEYALHNYDGTPLYQDGSEMNEWSSYVFDFGKRSVHNFLISSADFWMRKMHLDGLRVDAVSQTLYPRGSLHSGAATFYRDLNAYLHREFPGSLSMAEETRGLPGVTGSSHDKIFNQKQKKRADGSDSLSRGLGFDYKWNFSWLHFILREFITSGKHPTPFHERPYKHHSIGRALAGEGSEKLIYPLSHDEFANGKGSILDIMAGSTEERYAGVRLLLSQMMCMPGGKLSFMGNSLAQYEEWSWRHKDVIERKRPASTAAVQWELLDGGAAHPGHAGVHEMVKELNRIFLEHPALSRGGSHGTDKKWIDGKDEANNVVSYHRTSLDKSEQLVCIHNFSNHDFAEYTITFPDLSFNPEIAHLESLVEVFNSDDPKYAGSGKTNKGKVINVFNNAKGEKCFTIRLAPLSTIILKENFTRRL